MKFPIILNGAETGVFFIHRVTLQGIGIKKNYNIYQENDTVSLHAPENLANYFYKGALSRFLQR